MEKLKGSVSQQHLNGSLCTKNISVQTTDKVYFVNDHSKLKHLDYESSGHTGFAGVEFGTTVEWRERAEEQPPNGMILVYTDYRRTVDEQGKSILVPTIKIGNGIDKVKDLVFVDEDVRINLLEHINDNIRHITQAERDAWNDKLNYVEPGDTELLEFTRD